MVTDCAPLWHPDTEIIAKQAAVNATHHRTFFIPPSGPASSHVSFAKLSVHTDTDFLKFPFHCISISPGRSLEKLPTTNP